MDAKLVKDVMGELKDHLKRGKSHGDSYLFAPEPYRSEFDEAIGESHLRSAWDIMISLLEKLDTPFLLDRAKKEYQSFDKDPLDSQMGPEDPYLVWPWKIEHYADVAALVSIGKAEPLKTRTLNKLINILKSSERFVQDRQVFGWVPCSEADVHTRIETLLRCVYDDVRTKPRVSKATKGFEPDSALPSLGTLIEYKYISTKSDAKRVTDEVLADIGGYQTREYSAIIFVIYETQRLYAPTDWNQVIQDSKPPCSVEVVLLKGNTPLAGDKQKASRHKKFVADGIKGAIKTTKNKKQRRKL